MLKKWLGIVAWKIWLRGRPRCVHDLAAEFPLGSRFDDGGGGTLYLVGYNESDMLLVSAIDPAADFEAAVESRKPVCAEHYRPVR